MSLITAREADGLGCGRLSMIDTLATPNIVGVDASEHRAILATRANVLSQALDAQAAPRTKHGWYSQAAKPQRDGSETRGAPSWRC